MSKQAEKLKAGREKKRQEKKVQNQLPENRIIQAMGEEINQAEMEGVKVYL
jgi:hypothetical protein